MTFAEKLKNARKNAGMSQEALAEKLGVSRQAVTKWETERGIPDIDNLITISNLFGISVDEFLSQEKEAAVRKGYLYESKTEYDIDGRKRFDMKLGGASSLFVTSTDSEKVLVRLASNEIATLETDFKVRIDDIKGRIDVDVNRYNKMTEAKAKEGLFIEVLLPNKYLSHVELESNCDELHINNLACEQVEFRGKANKVFLESVEAALELDCNIDMDIKIVDFTGSLEINQITSTSRLTVPENFPFRALVKGFSNSVIYESNGEVVEDFSDANAENIVELNGIKSELLICRGKAVN
ncbi:helix-turn-helix transcriptional regulator [[Clostridium] cellulosi]|jgi:Helix-turn-helix.